MNCGQYPENLIRTVCGSPCSHMQQSLGDCLCATCSHVGNSLCSLGAGQCPHTNVTDRQARTHYTGANLHTHTHTHQQLKTTHCAGNVKKYSMCHVEVAHIQLSFSSSEERRKSVLLASLMQRHCLSFSSYSLFAQTRPSLTFPHSDLFKQKFVFLHIKPHYKDIQDHIRCSAALL